jgi:hypothetical protein
VSILTLFSHSTLESSWSSTSALCLAALSLPAGAPSSPPFKGDSSDQDIVCWDFLEEPVHRICIQGYGRGRVLHKEVCEVGIFCSLSGQLCEGKQIGSVLLPVIYILGRVWHMGSTH